MLMLMLLLSQISISLEAADASVTLLHFLWRCSSLLLVLLLILVRVVLLFRVVVVVVVVVDHNETNGCLERTQVNGVMHHASYSSC